MDLLRPEYTDQERARLAELESYLNISRAVLRNRLDQGLSQDELGKAAGTKQSRISELEAMRANPRLDTLDRIARVLGLAVGLIPRRKTTVPTARLYGQATVEGAAQSEAETTKRENGWSMRASAAGVYVG